MANLPDIFRTGRSPFRSMMRDFDEIFNQSLLEPLGPVEESNWGMSDFQESDDAYLLCFDLPGMRKEDVRIHVSGNTVTVSAERRQEEGKRGRAYRRYQRSVVLPTEVDKDHVEAQYNDGVLEVLMPKSEHARAKLIEIRDGKASLSSRLGATAGKKDVTPEAQQRH